MKSQIQAFINHGGDFDAMAVQLYRWQRENNPEYDRFCGDVDVRHWTQIPAVPTTLFRDLHFTCFPAENANHIFKTSGTNFLLPAVLGFFIVVFTSTQEKNGVGFVY